MMKIWLLLLLALPAMFPVVRLLHALLIDQTLRWGLLIAALAAHGVILTVGWRMHGYIALAVYLVLINVLWLVTPRRKTIAEVFLLSRFCKADIAHLERMIRVHPEHSAAHSALAEAYMQIGRLDDAVLHFEQAIALDPDHSRLEQRQLQRIHALRAAKGKGARKHA